MNNIQSELMSAAGFRLVPIALATYFFGALSAVAGASIELTLLVTWCVSLASILYIVDHLWKKVFGVDYHWNILVILLALILTFAQALLTTIIIYIAKAFIVSVF